MNRLMGAFVASAFLAVPAFAGPPSYTPPPPANCGTGWYFGIGGGANVFQDFGGERDLGTFNGSRLTANTSDKVGGFGGIKFGYTWPSAGNWRFGLEEDWFYNGVNASAHVDVDGVEAARVDGLLNTGAFMTNLMLHYAPNGGCGWQPYIFGGVGGWWGETGGDVDIVVRGQTRAFRSGDNGGAAFQLGAGFDYYFSPKMAFYTEYKFLDYTNAGGEFNNSNIGQHLVGAGLKFNF